MKAHRVCARLRKPKSLQFMLGAGACGQHTSAAHGLALINMALRYRRGDFEVANSLESNHSFSTCGQPQFHLLFAPGRRPKCTCLSVQRV